ncbi:uncharacterized protein BDZ83DRAFT_656876 [Colletotrichum acutatum]|uniref:Uncharacterized protein n=1 Tax=Glomerella acutata TaxID=27357 RepID=A0AAD8XCQ8_GLOAC|nr:uncharacterized protein BDZ83DRAFT_656876 [Colletotrichum acutatum]KAK1711232.1 hypothetical protein BDZ83DRAFT_656876 [Colletotrichum acutatum]
MLKPAHGAVALAYCLTYFQWQLSQLSLLAQPGTKAFRLSVIQSTTRPLGIWLRKNGWMDMVQLEECTDWRLGLSLSLCLVHRGDLMQGYIGVLCAPHPPPLSSLNPSSEENLGSPTLQSIQ